MVRKAKLQRMSAPPGRGEKRKEVGKKSFGQLTGNRKLKERGTRDTRPCVQSHNG